MQRTNQEAMRALVEGMTVKQLAEVAGLSIVSLVDRVWPESPKRTARAQSMSTSAQPKVRTKATSRPGARAKKSGPRALGPKMWNTRTLADREALDEAILAVLNGKASPKRATHIRSAVGGTSAQIRTRLNALIRLGKVDFSGQASAVKYWKL